MRPRRVPGLLGLGARRVQRRLTGPTPGRTLVSVIGVAMAIAVLVIVTGLSLGIAGSGTVASEGVNYWIVPDEAGVGNTPLAYEGSRLGAVHDTAARIERDDRVAYATPVSTRPVRLAPPGGDDARYVLVIGIVAPADGRPVAGVSTAAMTPGDPRYTNGTYDGPWTGELVATPAASGQLDAVQGDRLVAGGTNRSFTVTTVTDENLEVGAGTVPVVLVHLAELQTVTGSTASDQADQILVASTEAGVRDTLAGVYPRTSVVARSGFSRLSPTAGSLPFAMAVAAGLVALGIGVAFVATMMGLELTAERQSLAVLGAMGFGRGSLGLVLVAETLTVTMFGGVVGVGLGWLGIQLLNAGVGRVVDLGGAATFDPLLVPYALLAAFLVGLLSVGYPLLIAWRTDVLEELGR